jgi:putative sigma-54 modulation protein
MCVDVRGTDVRDGRPMRMFIGRPTGWPPGSVELVRTRLEFALGRFAGRVRSLRVRLADVNGARGGVDKRCLISINLDRPHRVIVIDDVDADHATVIDRATHRAARTVARALEWQDDWRARRLEPETHPHERKRME